MERVFRFLLSWLGTCAHAVALVFLAIAVVDGSVASSTIAGAATLWCLTAITRMLDVPRLPAEPSTWMGSAAASVLEELGRVGFGLGLFAAIFRVLFRDGEGPAAMLVLAIVSHLLANAMALCRRAISDVDAPWTGLAHALFGLMLPGALLRGAGRLLLAVVATGAAWSAGLLLITGAWQSAVLVALVWLGFSMALRAATDGELARMAERLGPA